MKKILFLSTDSWIAVLKALVFPFCCALMLIAVWPVAQWLPAYYRDVFTGAVAALGAFLLSLLFLKWSKLNKEAIGIVPGRQTLKRLFTGFIFGLLLVAAHIGLLLLTGHISFSRTANAGGTMIVYNLFLYLVFALREELAYRGFPLQSLARKMAPWKAQLIIAAAFAIEHKVGGYTWVQAFTGAALGSILFGIAALKTKGLALPLSIHAAWNFGQWLMGFKSNAGIYHFVIEKGYEKNMESIGSVAFWIVIGVAIGIGLKFRGKREV